MPEAPSNLNIELLASTMAEDRGLVGEITDLVNEVYATAEAGLWVDGAARTTTAEISEMVAAGEIAVARAGGEIVGSIRIQQLDGRAGEFGMLVADPAHRGAGVGRELIRFAEDLSRRRGLETMQLELLVPRDWSHPNKEFLHAWYTRIGYRRVRTGTIEESYPHLGPLLATECDFVIYEKPLAAEASRS
jgi:GNAT superfamily N-acetyltransferase